MNHVKIGLGVIGFFIFILLVSSVFTVDQGSQGILLQLGRLVKDPTSGETRVLNPGLHMKMPMIETVRFFDTRLQTLDIKSSRIVTKEKKDVIVDYYVKWRIQDLARYFKSTGGNELKAQTLLEQQLNTYLRAEFGRRTIADLVSSVRDDVMDALRDKAEQQASGLGVHVVDVRIKGIELPENTSNAIYQRMRADMQKIANRHRADGNAAAESIQAGADADVTVLLAKAQSEGTSLRAKGDAAASKIYAQAFDQNKAFFKYYRSLKAYQQSFHSKQDLLIIDESSAFFDYFKRPMVNK